jgi:hypothetical protein
MHGVTSAPAAAVGLAIILGFGVAAWGEAASPAPATPEPPQSASGTAAAAAPTSTAASGSTETAAAASAPTSTSTETVAAAPVSRMTGSISLGSTFVHVNGNDQTFRHDYRMDDNFFYGLRNMDLHAKQPDGWREDITVRALQPFDYGADVKVSKNRDNFIETYYNQFPTYYDSTKAFYAFKPFTYALDRRLVTVRQDAGMTASWQSPGQGPLISMNIDHWDKDGGASTLWGGQVTNGVTTAYRYPQFQDVDEQRNRIRLQADQKVGKFNLKIGVEAQSYDGTDRTTTYTFGSTGLLTQRRYIIAEPNFTELRPYWELTGDLVDKILRFEYSGNYSLVETDGTYNEYGVLVPSGAHSTTNNFINNTHDGRVSETEHKFRLVYTPSSKATIFGGFGLKYIHSQNESAQNEDRLPAIPNGIVDRITLADTTESRMVWMGNAGIQVKPLSWLGGAVEARYENNSLDRSWFIMRASGTGADNRAWVAEGPSERLEYLTSLTAQATPDLKFIARWGQKFIDYDYVNVIDSINGTPDQGLVGNNSRHIDEWSLLTQYRPNPYLSASYKLVGRITDYSVKKNANGNVATWEDINNILSVTLAPTDKLTMTLSGSIQRAQMENKAENAAKIPIAGFDGDTRSWGADVSYRFSDKITMSGGIFREYADAIFDYNSTNVYGGAVYKINKAWSADFRYTFAKYGEKGNADLNDYSAHIFTVGLVARF